MINNMDKMQEGNAIGIDLGGTKIKGALVDLATGEPVKQLSVDTLDGHSAHWKDEIRKMVTLLAAASGGEIRGVGLAAPGIVAADNERIVSMPGRMQGLEGCNWGAFLQQPVYVLNDAHAATVAEATYGSAAGYRHALMLTLGTGVGGGLWLDGKLYQGAFNRAGHLGHVTVDGNRQELDITNIPGSLEQLIGDVTVPARTFKQYRNTHELLAGYRQGEPVAVWAWLNAVRQLAIALASLINVFSPEVIVLGGGISRADAGLFDPLETFMEIYEWRPQGSGIPIRKARYEALSGAVGAAVCSVEALQMK